MDRSAKFLRMEARERRRTIYLIALFGAGSVTIFLFRANISGCIKSDSVHKGFETGTLAGWLHITYDGPIGYNDRKGPFFKFGIYRDDIPPTNVLYMDEYMRGFSKEDVHFTSGVKS